MWHPVFIDDGNQVIRIRIESVLAVSLSLSHSFSVFPILSIPVLVCRFEDPLSCGNEDSDDKHEGDNQNMQSLSLVLLTCFVDNLSQMRLVIPMTKFVAVLFSE